MWELCSCTVLTVIAVADDTAFCGKDFFFFGIIIISPNLCDDDFKVAILGIFCQSLTKVCRAKRSADEWTPQKVEEDVVNGVGLEERDCEWFTNLCRIL